MMLQARDGGESLRRFLEYGGDATLASYSPFGDTGSLIDVPDAHWHFLEQETLGWFETETHFLVHANAYPDYPLVSNLTTCFFGNPSKTRLLMVREKS